MNSPDLQPAYKAYLIALKKKGFEGDINTDFASRSVMATDNSVYTLFPQAVLAPRSHEDVVRIFKLLQKETYKTVHFAARGGATATNGQALTDGIVIDFRKYLSRIHHFSAEDNTIEIEPGLSLDDLNHYLKQHDCFFPPQVSPSNRASLGGMVSTDASGKGSCLYGKTSEYIQSLTAVLANGETIVTNKIPLPIQENTSLEQKIALNLLQCYKKYEQQILTEYPKLKRFMTGYDLPHTIQKKHIDITRIIAGAEGSLATITKIKLRVLKRPKYTALFVLQHPSFQSALQLTDFIHQSQAAAIEVMDATVLRLANADPMYKAHLDAFPGEIKNNTALSLLEYHADTETALNHCIQNVLQHLQKHKTLQEIQHIYHSHDKNKIAAIWQIRKHSVEYLGRLASKRRPVSGIEDTIVPPHALPAYIAAFKALLDKHQLPYGMFGHLDAGCIHVRPALDLSDPKDEALYFQLSDEVASLVQSFGGIIWGEHGKGLRSHYIHQYFSPMLYTAFREVKSIFDPNNHLNPNKIATPLNAKNTQLPPIDAIERYARLQRQISTTEQTNYANALLCNGNASCLSTNLKQQMCPSYQAMQNPVHSPKGRANSLRFYLIEKSKNSVHTAQAAKACYKAMHACLACKACTVDCPVSVDIPSMKAYFYQAFFSEKNKFFLKKNRRPLRDTLIAYTEKLEPRAARHYPKLRNYIVSSAAANLLFHKLGLYDLPQLAIPNFQDKSKDLFQKAFEMGNLYFYSHLEREPQLKNVFIKKRKAVYLLADFLHYSYEPSVLNSAITLLLQLGYSICIDDKIEIGKAWFNQGYLNKFKKLTQKNQKRFAPFIEAKIPLLGLEPSLVSCLSDDYKKFSTAAPPVLFFPFFLESALPTLSEKPTSKTTVYHLFLHCNEVNTWPGIKKLWERLFQRCHLSVQIYTQSCCGIAGSFGHETQYKAVSQKLFNIHWRDLLSDIETTQMLATGFSCRSQIKRQLGIKVQHPIEIFPFFSSQVK